MFKKNAVSIGLVAVSAGYLLMALDFPFGTLSKPKSGFVPTILGVLGVVLSILIICVDSRTPAEKKKEPVRWKQVITNPITGYMASLLAIALLFETLGSLIAITLLVFVLCKISGLEGWVKPLITAVITSVVVWVVFGIWLQCHLPSGLLTMF